jgi:hypothetical protein
MLATIAVVESTLAPHTTVFSPSAVAGSELARDLFHKNARGHVYSVGSDTGCAAAQLS